MFDLITTLKEVGLSLEEIKNYMDERDTDAFMELLKEQDKLLKHADAPTPPFAQYIKNDKRSV